MSATVRDLCEQTIGLLRGKRLILTAEELQKLNSLDYDGLVEAHAQDEAVVCALNFERVRDRLLQIYPWVFARKRLALGTDSREIPADNLAVLCVLKDGEPMEYDTANGKLPDEADEIIYTAKAEEVEKWPPIFSDVFVYSLAIEICPAVTGTAEYVQLLEQKAQELIHRAHQLGLIKAETRLTLKDELYSRAIGLVRGQRTMKETSPAATQQGIDTAGFVNDRMTAEYQACIRAADSVRDRLLGSYAWVFARKTEAPAQLSERVPGWRYTYALPADCLRVTAVIGGNSCSEELTDYETAGRELYSNRDVVYIRYTAKIEDSTKWDAIFTEAFVILLAEEVALNVTGDKNIVALLEQKFTKTIGEAMQVGAIQKEIKILKLGTVNRQYLDYSGIPTVPCNNYPYGRSPCYEDRTGELCSWGN